MEDLDNVGGSDFQRFLLDFGTIQLTIPIEDHVVGTGSGLSPFEGEVTIAGIDDIIPVELEQQRPSLEDNSLSSSCESSPVDQASSLPPPKRRGRPPKLDKPRPVNPPRVKAYELPPTTKPIRNAITARKNRVLAKEREQAKDEEILRLRNIIKEQAVRLSDYEKRFQNILENVLSG
ncbi:uncharacterized protein LOC110855059 [Folsomia candida]|uniref:BZIP domain-containing protein n=1 Tax=Folsomia candida TaxID=158441 RepID=A0A226DT72_FOLCA|nr:uncharacterized protein LOC110855059 [Folsomia candida]OXA48695.1 hypothetical protein Fcan01_16755 [Folsomia candida]